MPPKSLHLNQLSNFHCKCLPAVGILYYLIVGYKTILEKFYHVTNALYYFVNFYCMAFVTLAFNENLSSNMNFCHRKAFLEDELRLAFTRNALGKLAAIKSYRIEKFLTNFSTQLRNVN